MKLDELFPLFLKEKQFLSNVSLKTIRFYKHSWRAFRMVFPEVPDPLTRQHLSEFVMQTRGRGVSPTSCNVYIRGVNSFLTWLYESEYLPEKLKIQQLKEDKKVIQTFSEAQLRAILSWKPSGFCQMRLHALLATLIDTGIRIDECLGIIRDGVDLENLLLTVKGKGQKERILPISIELRKILFRWLRKHNHRIVFCTRDGAKMSYRNAYRDFQLLAEKLGITGVRVSPHTLRRQKNLCWYFSVRCSTN